MKNSQITKRTTLPYRHCSSCGKDFICSAPGQYKYKLLIKGHYHYYCCWACYQKGKADNPKKDYWRYDTNDRR